MSHICILTTTSGSFRFTSLCLDRSAPASRMSFWESTSFIMPSNLFARIAKVPSGSSTSASPETSSGVYSPRYLPMLWVIAIRSAMGSRNLSSNDATAYPGPLDTSSNPSVSASRHLITSARGMSFDSPDSSKKKVEFTILGEAGCLIGLRCRGGGAPSDRGGPTRGVIEVTVGKCSKSCKIRGYFCSKKYIYLP